jgi:hypothetical protein
MDSRVDRSLELNKGRSTIGGGADKERFENKYNSFIFIKYHDKSNIVLNPEVDSLFRPFHIFYPIINPCFVIFG